jgi:hypothetical protein
VQLASPSLPVLVEAAQRYKHDNVWTPGIAELLAYCRQVAADARRGFRQLDCRIEELEAPEIEQRKVLEKMVCDAEDEADPRAEFKRYCKQNQPHRAARRMRVMEEARARICRLEQEIRMLPEAMQHWFHDRDPGLVKLVTAQRTRQLELALAEASAELAAIEKEAEAEGDARYYAEIRGNRAAGRGRAATPRITYRPPRRSHEIEFSEEEDGL